ncbi:MAG: potassium channel family protein [Actinobacteria bacterium]|nr:potassium channel family protein [Actinomycetota bacterium]
MATKSVLSALCGRWRYSLPLVFAKLDWVLSIRDHGCFTEPLSSRTDALYFAVTTLASGGPGSISPVTALCRQLITIQVSLGYVLTAVLLAVAVSTLIGRMTARHP